MAGEINLAVFCLSADILRRRCVFLNLSKKYRFMATLFITMAGGKTAAAVLK